MRNVTIAARLGIVILGGLSLTACGKLPFLKDRPEAERKTPAASRPEPVSPPPAASARTVDQFDTTTADERKKAAAAPKPGGETSLGDTVASLGDPAAPGFWLETPLVSAPAKGRVLNPATGKSAQVDLIPIDGPKTAGSRISLAAMRLIEAPLTDLPTLRVFAGG
ncbi:hypothetical protein [Antarctobacter heliothermus]|uniref:D-galactarate dehydratase n=1 Tax=Antarctobacter heliothermus TaxID=74033 RepID=A0A239D5G9_9RHOB|nr:hypothetical protein [Antarctobacter heliothermus]SNS27665.1 hypothetical protein SAMN04488078_100994 [Antarctobacter heliothermus]